MARPWMPLYVADYLGDTGHLSTIEHGAYMLLIMHYWQTGRLPSNETHLARICRMPDADWSAIRDTIAGLFESDWRHKRIDEELATVEDMVAKRRAAGKAGASARYGDRMASAQQSDGIARGNSPTPSPEERSLRDPKNSEACGHEASAASPASELENILDSEHAAAVVDHRKKIKKPLTLHAAKLLAGKFRDCPDPNAAADAMIANGWQGFEPEWLANRKGTGPPRPERRDSYGQLIS